MPPLKNNRYEKVAYNLFMGMIQKDAVIDAGFSPRTADLTGFRLIRNDKIQARIKELHRKAEKPGIMTVGERKERLSEIGRARLTDFVDKQGNITLDAENNGALAEVVVTEVRGSKGDALSISNTRIKLHDPAKGIDLLNKMDKLYTEPLPAGDIVQNFVFILPDGTKVLPSQLGKHKELEHYAPQAGTD